MSQTIDVNDGATITETETASQEGIGDSTHQQKPGRIRQFLKIVVVNLIILSVLDVIVGATLNDTLMPRKPRVGKHPVLGFSNIPNVEKPSRCPEHSGYVIRYNSQGLRADRDYTVEKPDNTRRIMIVGDSHTEGAVANHETYAAQLEQIITESDGAATEVINLGTVRYSPYQGYLRLKHQFLEYDPDVVVAAFYVGNDFLDMIRFDDRPSMVHDDNGGVSTRDAKYYVYAEPPLKPWLGNSLLYRLYDKHYRYSVVRAQMTIDLVSSLGGGLSESIDLIFDLKSCGDRAIISQSLVQAAFFRRFEHAPERSFALTQHLLRLHKQLAAENGYELHTLLIPTRLQIEPEIERDRVSSAMQAMKLDGNPAQIDDEIHDEFLDLLERERIPTIDPRESLRAAASPEAPLYWSSDYHVNVIGCRILAESIHKHLDGV